MCRRTYLSILLLISLFLSLSVLSSAQQKGYKIDHISNYVSPPSQWAKQEDTNAVLKLINESIPLLTKEPDSAALLLRQGIGISKKINYIDGQAWATALLGELYAQQNKFALAHQLLEKAMHIVSPTNYYVKWKVYFNSGVTYYKQGDFENSSKMLIAAIKTMEGKTSQDSDRNLSLTYSTYATLLTDMEQPNMAAIYLDKGEALLRKQKDKTLLGTLLYNKARYLIYLNKNQEALITYKEAYALSRENKDSKLQKACLTALGSLYTYQTPSRTKTAIPLLEEAYSIPTPFNIEITLSTLKALSSAYYANRQFHLAEKYLLEALEIIEKNGAAHTRMSINILGSFSELYMHMGRYQEAYRYLDRHHLLRDSIMGEEKRYSIQQLELKFQMAQKDNELTQKELLIAQQQIRIGKNRTWAYVGSSSALLLACISILLYRNMRHRKRWDQERLSVLKKEQELALLKISVEAEETERIRIGRELHDGVGGLLSALKMNLSVVRKENRQLKHSDAFQNVFVIADEATDELRKIAHNLVPEMLFKGGIAEAVRNFCEKIPQSEALDIRLVSYGTPRRLNSKFELSLYRIIQELVNNVIKHAQASTALVQLIWHDNQLNITLEDDGIGFDYVHLQTQNHTGIGLKNIQARVHSLNGQIDIDSRPGSGTTIELEFNFE